MKRTDREPVEIAFAISTGTVFSQGLMYWHRHFLTSECHESFVQKRSAPKKTWGSNGTSLGVRGKGIESQLSVGRV